MPSSFQFNFFFSFSFFLLKMRNFVWPKKSFSDVGHNISIAWVGCLWNSKVGQIKNQKSNGNQKQSFLLSIPKITHIFEQIISFFKLYIQNVFTRAQTTFSKCFFFVFCFFRKFATFELQLSKLKFSVFSRPQLCLYLHEN